MSVRFVIQTKVRGEQLVLMVQIIVRVFFQSYMDCLGKKCVLMIGGFGVFVVVVGPSWGVVGGDWCGGCWLAILKFFFGFLTFYEEILYLL